MASFYHKEASIVYVAREVEIDRSRILVSAKLVNPDGCIVGEQMFSQSIYTLPGDLLRMTYAITWTPK